MLCSAAIPAPCFLRFPWGPAVENLDLKFMVETARRLAGFSLYADFVMVGGLDLKH